MSIEGAKKGLEYLEGKRTGVRYRDLERVLLDAGAADVSGKGSHRTWKHRDVGELLTLVGGAGDVLPVYIRKVRKYLKLITKEV